MYKWFKRYKLVSFLFSSVLALFLIHYSSFSNPALATCYCANPGADACKCSAAPPANATFNGNQDGVNVKCTSQEEANSTFERKNPICGFASETIPYCAPAVGDSSDVTCYGTEFASGATNIPLETGGLINWGKSVDFNGFHADNVAKLMTCKSGLFCCGRSDITCDDSGVPKGGSCSPQDGPGNPKVCTSIPIPPPGPGMACDQTVDPEFHSLRPYRGSFCSTSAETVTACGNDLILQKEFQLTPGGGRCTANANGGTHCEYELSTSSNIQISVPDGELPIAGNTQLVKNSINATNQLDDKTKTNEYVSWYLNGTNFRAEDSPEDSQKATPDFAGPLKKLLPQSILYQKQIESISKIDTQRHNQIVVCGKNSLGKAGELLHIGSVDPIECYKGDGGEAQGEVFRLVPEGGVQGPGGILIGGNDGWSGELAVVNTIIDKAVEVIASILPFHLGAEQIKEAIGKPWNNRTPPLEGGLDMEDKPFTEITYRKAYQEWKGKTCAIITFPIINVKQLVCIDNPLVPNKYANLFPYLPLSSTEDLPGSISVKGGVGFQAAPMFPGADASSCGGSIGFGVAGPAQTVNLADYIAGAGFIEHSLSTGENIRFTSEGGSGPGSPVRMYKNANYEQFFVGGGVYRREDTSWAPLSGFQDATCSSGGKAVLTTDPSCNQYSEGQDVTNDGALWAPASASVGSSWNTQASQLVTVKADSLPSRKYCALGNLSGYEYPKACNQSSSMTLSAFYPAGKFNFCSKVKNLTDMIVIETTGGPGAGDTFYYMKGYGLVGFEVTTSQSTAQGGAGVSDVVFESSNKEHVLYVPHMEETTELSSFLQSTFAAKGEDTGGGSAAGTQLLTKPHCELDNFRTNPGDDLLGEKSTPVQGKLNFKFRTSCDFGPARFDTVKYEECRNAGRSADDCQNEATTTSTCTRNAQVAMSVYTKTPKVDELWYRTVFGNMSIFKRIFPQELTSNSQILDLPAVTKAKYESTSGDKVLAGDPNSNRPGGSAEIFIPHLGGVYDYFLKGIQTALRPKDLASTTITGITTTAKNINCNQAAPDPGVTPGLLSRDVLVNEFKNEFKGNHILECYNDVVAKAKAAGYDPAFAMAIWIEESGASDYNAFPTVADFGCAVNTPKADFNAQINCFLGLKSFYSSSTFAACRPAGTLRMEDFLLIYSEGATHACKVGDACYRKYCLNSGFPARIASYYSRVSGGKTLPVNP